MQPQQELLVLEAFLANHLSACQYLVEREQEEQQDVDGLEIEARQLPTAGGDDVAHLVVVWPENYMMYDVTAAVGPVSQAQALQLLWQRLDQQRDLRYPEIDDDADADSGPSQ